MDSASFSMAFIIILIIRPVVPGGYQSRPIVNTNVCDTRQCNDFAKLLNASMNPQVRPCYDFYEYVCGNFAKNNGTEDYTSWFSYDRIKRKMQKKVIHYLKNARKQTPPNDPLRWAMHQFDVCMNVSQLGRLGVKPLFDIMEKSDGNAFYKQVLSTPSKKWHEVHDYYKDLTGNGGLFTITVRYVPLFEEYSINMDVVDNFFMHTPRSLHGSDIQRYKEFLINIATEIHRYCCNTFLIKANINDIGRVIRFRESLTKIKDTVEGVAEGFTVEKLQAATEARIHMKTINWLHLLRSTFKKIPSVKIVPTTRIYFKNLPLFLAILEVVNQTSDEVISNHLHLYFLERYIMYSNMKMYMLYQGMHPKVSISRSTRCVSDRTLTRAVNFIYASHLLSKNIVPMGKEVVSDVRRALHDQIHRTQWMSKSAKQTAMEKVHMAYFSLSYNKWDKNVPNLLKYYSKLEITEDYLQNALNFDIFAYTEDLSLLSKRRAQGSMKSRASSNSGYSMVVDKTTGDNIALPLMIHQLPFFGDELPNAINYAGLGTIYGDQLADVNDGWEHSKRTNNQRDAASLKTYSERLNCYAARIADVVSKEFVVSINVTVSSAVAQYESLVAAFEAYLSDQMVHRRNWHKIINFDNINDEKLFFVAYAMSRCGASNTWMFPSTTNPWGKSVDLPDSVTVNAALSNFQAFSDSFDCKHMDPMNALPKCVFFNEQ